MERLSRQTLADAILLAPGWARVALTLPDRRKREEAADALAATIADRLGLDLDEPDRLTLSLPL